MVNMASDTTLLCLPGADKGVVVEPDLTRIDDRYLIQSELGRGGMGVVYRAKDLATGDLVALKVCRRADDRARARFRREGRIVAELDHPGIVRLLHSSLRSPVPFLVYELVPGARSLEDALAQAPRHRRVELVRDLARALGSAHRVGVIHRDVKPSNVLVDRLGNVRVTDFGLATRADLPRISRRSRAIGTPIAMSPEQFRADPVSPATDVWALGLILFESLTGTSAFPADTVEELADRVLTCPAPSPRSIDPTIPRELEAICARALRPDAPRRYPTADALADDLDRWLIGGLRRLALGLRLRLEGAVLPR